MAEGLDEVETTDDNLSPAESHHESIKSDIHDAWDKVVDEEPAAKAEAAPERAERVRDEKGRFQPKEETRQAEPPKGRSRQTATAELEPVESTAKVAKPDAPVKADPVDTVPQSFKPGLLEDWKAVPRAVREEIHRREAESYALLEQTKGQRQQLQQIQQAVQPYEALLQAEGGSVPTALRNYLQAATLMRSGPMGPRIEWVAKLINTYIPQQHWEHLDKALAVQRDGGPQSASPAYQQQEFRDPRVDQWEQRFQQQQQQEWQQGFQEAQAEKDSWVAERQPEFLPWVKNRMATLLETAARDGEELGFEEAYDAACRTHPEVRKILTQREEAARAQPSAVQRSRRASVSLKPQGAVAPSGGNEGNSRRGDIEDAWEAVMGR